jgi:hypothetical protein
MVVKQIKDKSGRKRKIIVPPLDGHSVPKVKAIKKAKGQKKKTGR